MSIYKKIQIVVAALFVGLLSMVPLTSFSQNENGVTDQGESTTVTGRSYVNENGKFVCWPRLTPNGKLLTYGPIVDTEDPTDVTSTSVTLHGNILHDGWCNGITGQGFEISLYADFSTIYMTVVKSPVPTFTPCNNYPTCTCTDNKYEEPATGLTPGVTYYYRAYATNDCGTGYGDTLSFTTENDITVTVTGDATLQFCPDGSGSVTYTATLTPSMPSPTYQWYVDDVLVAGETNATYTPTFTSAQAGNHTVKCVVTVSGLTPEGSTNTNVSTYTVPSLTITGDASICAGATGNLTATTGFSSYAWSSNVVSSSTNTATYTVADTYSVTATTSDGCTTSATKTVEVNSPAISGTLSVSSQTICYGNNASLTASFSGTSTGTLSYQWYKDGAALSGQTSSTLNLTAPTASGTYDCKLTANVNGCTVSTTSSGMLTVNHPVANIASLTASPSSVCPGETSVLTATAGSTTGTLSYQWTQGGTNVGTNSTSYTTPALSTTTTYYLTQTATVGSCTATDTKSVAIAVTTPSATTNAVASVTCVSAVLGGSNNDCGTTRGFVYGTSSNPTVGASGTRDVPVASGTGAFPSTTLTGLTPNTPYHVRAYVLVGSTYYYGTDKDFTTQPIGLEVVSQNGTINLCSELKQTVVTMTATPSCDADNVDNSYAWSLSPVYPYSVSADGKTITVTVTSSTSEQFNVTGTCTLTHSTGYTVTASDYSIIYKEGTSPDICVCEDSYIGTVAITDMTNINQSTIQWYAGTDATGTPIAALNGQTGINTGSYTEGYYTIKCASLLGCINTRTVTLGFPFTRCASLGTTGNTSENANANVDGVWQITDNRSANGNSSTPYRVIQLGSQCWMAENLRYKQAVDGYTDGISRTALVNQSIYTYPIYFTWPEPGTRKDNWTAAQNWSAADVTARYGYLYTWVGAMDMPATMQTRGTLFPPEQRDYHIQGVCPDGWHLPTDGEFFQLEHELGVSRADSAVVTTCIRPDNEPDVWRNGDTRGSENDAGTVAATGCDWYQNTAAHCPQDYCYDVRNDRGFSAVPGGVFVPQYDPISQCFQIVGQQANFWTASQAVSLHLGHEDFSDAAYTHHLIASKAGWGRYRADKHNGLNVRCVRDMVTTATPTNVTTSSATVGGTVLEDGGYAITERGICWSNTGTPSISGSHRAVGSGVGSFTTTLTTSDISSGEYQYCAYAINSEGVYYGLTQTVELLTTPIVVTGEVSDVDIHNLSIELHGNLVSTGGYSNTERGICWGTSANPTTADNHTPASGTGTGAFSIPVTGLTSGTTYHYRAYAVNGLGSVYGEDKTFIVTNPCAGIQSLTFDGSTYYTTAIGSQCWLTASIRADNYADGTPVLRGSAPDGSNVGMNYSELDGYYYEAYNVAGGHNQAVIDNWGRLYNWKAATRGQVYNGTPVQGICPNGWHIPTKAEYQELMQGAGDQYSAGTPYAFLVCKNNTWTASSVTGSPGAGVGGGASVTRTDFAAYPAGIIRPAYSGGAAVYTNPENQGNVANFWCADANVYPYFCALIYNDDRMQFSGGTLVEDYNAFGFSVRCVKN